MCNRRLVSFGESCLQFEYPAILVDQHIGQRQTVYVMDSPAAVSDSDPGSDPVPGSSDGTPRFKFLCSFSGSILLRPQDSKLRYVGGETRIVCFPRDIVYEELMGRMRELYESVVVIKYQQPDEDLDALVSVVNDDDVMNMMEEYDKLGSGEGLSRLRIFLFSQMDQDFPAHYIDGDNRDSERRYVDALNNMNDPSEFWRFQPNESSMMRGLDEFHLAEQLYNPVTYDGSVHNQRNGEMPLLPYGLRHIAVPCVGSGQFLPPGSQRLSEIDAPWSPGYYSPRHHGFHGSEFLSSPASARLGMPFGEAADNRPDPAPEESVRSQLNHQLIHENSSQTQDNGLWLQGDKSGPPGNASNITNFSHGNGGCEPCKIPMPRNQSIFEQINVNSSLHGLNNPCMDCRITPDNHILNANTRMHPGIYQTGQPDPHGHSDGWVLQHQLSSQVDYLRANLPGAGRLLEHYLADGSSSKYPFGHANLVDGHHPSFNHGNHLLGSDILHEHPFSPHGHVPFTDDRYIRYRNMAFGYGPENPYPVSHLHEPAQSMWRNIQNPVHGSPPYEASNTPKLTNGAVSPGLPGHTPEGSPRFGVVVHYQNGSCDPSNNCLAIEGNSSPGLMLNPNTHSLENGMFTSGQVGENDLPSRGENIDQKTSHGDGTSSLANPAESAVNISFENQDSHLPKNTEIAIILVDGVTDISVGVRRVTLEGGIEEVNTEAADQKLSDQNKVTEVAADEPGMVVIEGERELVSDNESNMKIEPTKAEEEAIARGLQTIKNEDLEEIRVLGSGTYGAVYHGKWKGSDVAIKRIKASCFAGRPSERERLISDFWREASILSSLHHPNVVSFYGIVRDGPDGSLATVTEFMVNGSLKQFLQKKDRTIDRRKRLILAMDSAFGMEYLHGKNIVHFDLKCENLLVNMRDPQRPVCKIGDLGLSKVKQHTLVSGGVRGTLPWMAPELLSGKSNMVSEKIDVYSFGIVMWELLTGDEPYADMHCASIIGGIVNNSLRPQIPSWCDPEWRSLMESSWASDPTKRPSFSEISQKLRSMAAAMNVK